MSEKLLTLHYNLDGQKVTITAQRATARIGVKRYRLMAEGEEQNTKETDDDLKPLRFFVYPNVVAGTLEVKGMAWPMSFEEFIELPEDLIIKWQDAVYKLNPGWGTMREADQSEEKKEPM